MSISDFVFIHKVKSLPSDKNAFLLTSMELLRQDFYAIKPVIGRKTIQEEIEKCKNDRQALLQKGVLIIWLLLDSPQELSVSQVKEYLSEKKTRAGNVDIGNIPNRKREEYEKLLVKYVNLSDGDKEFFLNEVKHPVAQQRMACFPMLEYQKG